jgi:hypothetical protein
MPIATSQKLFGELFPFPKIQCRYLDAPLLRERTEYISHILGQGQSRKTIRRAASMQLNAIRLLELREARLIHSSEVAEAGSRWAIDTELHKHNKPGKASAYRFNQIVSQWLAFSGLLIKLELPALPFDPLVKAYMEEMHVVRGLSATTIYGRHRRLASLQRWLGERHDTFINVGVNDIDDYMDELRTKGFRPRSLLTICETIRDFFREPLNNSDLQGPII